MNEDIKKIYDYVCKQQDIHDKLMDGSSDSNVTSYASASSNMCWVIKQFIEINFNEL